MDNITYNHLGNNITYNTSDHLGNNNRCYTSNIKRGSPVALGAQAGIRTCQVTYFISLIFHLIKLGIILFSFLTF